MGLSCPCKDHLPYALVETVSKKQTCHKRRPGGSLLGHVPNPSASARCALESFARGPTAIRSLPSMPASNPAMRRSADAEHSNENAGRGPDSGVAGREDDADVGRVPCEPSLVAVALTIATSRPPAGSVSALSFSSRLWMRAVAACRQSLVTSTLPINSSGPLAGPFLAFAFPSGDRATAVADRCCWQASTALTQH